MRVAILFGLIFVVGCTQGELNLYDNAPTGPTMILLSELPECYITEGQTCAANYGEVGIYGNTGNAVIQCCKGPGYILQGIENTVWNSLINENSYTKEVFDAYNCSLDESRKVYCTDYTECYKRPELEGCSKPDACNWCCGKVCTMSLCVEGKDLFKKRNGDWNVTMPE